ncbi:MAG: acetate--CoA ligase family protein [Ignavibacteriaceae bacterium]
MKTLFINEVECYSVLNKYGIRLPRYSFITSITKTFHSSFDHGEDIVLKGVVDNIWHKSDQNLLKFSTFSNSEIKKTYKQFYSINLVKKDWKGLLICERINYADLSLPSELLVSIRRDNSCGNVITLGFGGLYTELWSAEFLNSVLHFFPDLYSETTALKQLEDSLLFKILLGKIRQGTKLTTQKNIKNFLSSIWRLSKNLVKEKISFIEINPLVISKDGRFVALDAVGKFETPNSVYNNHIDRISKDELKELFNPQRIAIAGVSSNKKAFANIVLDHLKKSKIEQKNIVILKPGAEEFEEIKCIAAISELKDPVDILILSLPAPTALEVIKQIYQTNKVKIIQLVSGGIGDSADHDDYKNQLLEIIRVNKHKDRPLIIGPNALGILLAPQKLNTLFIPENKLRINFDPDSNIGLISQSGAFFITRISKMPSLSVRFGMCVGNQLDLSATIILRAMLNDNAIEVVGLYLEGPPQGRIISNAGYETVAGADKSVTGLQPFSKETNKKLLQVFKEAKLSNIVSTNNPLDLTPMANDQVYLECCKIILNDSQTDLLICGIVPLTVMVETEDEEIVNANALRYYHLVTEVKKPFAIVVEGGKLYDKFKDSFLNKNIPVFNSIQDVFEVLNR